MTILGAILAGGQSRRFGSDKAQAMLGGVSLIERVGRALAAQVDNVVVVGRTGGLADLPPGVGPLGGLAAGLRHAHERGYSAVLTVPCDTPLLPMGLMATLAKSGGAAYLPDLPVIGLWPSELFAVAVSYIAATADHSMRKWAAHIDATPVKIDEPIPNINRPGDLTELTGR